MNEGTLYAMSQALTVPVVLYVSVWGVVCDGSLLMITRVRHCIVTALITTGLGLTLSGSKVSSQYLCR
ncbi:hypothetical protein E2C01_093704 [Portunus trituberculatus]|uniref:Uncharacterized protein n=1 Tax=Portunus trituberculatus TaxID=210409 RepID=A0A5B7JZG0_PORTR|nr:hypothetical protein [Portunus trituberculatus]